MDIIERYKGSLHGLAVGDAMGTTVEFFPRGSFAPVTDVVGGGVFELQPGEWTDDTSMALCLAESLIECNGFDSVDQLNRYRNWYRSGYMSCKDHCFDIGHTTREALQIFERTKRPFCGSTDPRSAGNGSIMRIAPVALYYANTPALCLTYAASSSRTTHAHPLAVDGCRYLALLIMMAVNGASKEELVSDSLAQSPHWVREPLAEDIRQVATGSYKNKHEFEIRSSGYVVHTLEAALWAFYQTSSFEEGLLAVVNLGEDADTTGAVYGQLAGAYYGLQAIPFRWREKIAKRQLIEAFATQLYTKSKR